jgi:uncharacterized protein (TIGR03067 family)
MLTWRRALLFAFLSSFGCAAFGADPLEGTWEMKARTETGEDRDDKIPAVQWTFSKGKITGKLGDKSGDVGTYKVDADAKPGVIDLTMAGKGEFEQPGIFAIDGDKLQICVPDDSRGEKRRPKSLKEKNFRIEIWEFERVKQAN